MTTLDPHRETCPDCDCCTIALCATARLNRQSCQRYALVVTADAEQRVAACQCAPVRQTYMAQERPRVVIPFTTGARS